MIRQAEAIEKIALFRDREHAALLLAKMLERHRGTNSVILAVPRGGVPVGDIVARHLNLPMAILSCRKITHPGDSRRSIGSVSLQEVVIHDRERDLPQEYIQHTINRLRTGLRHKAKMYRNYDNVVNLKGKTVIVVDDWLTTGDTILAGLKDIRRQQPKEIIVAAPVLTIQAHEAVSREADGVIFVLLDDVARLPAYKYFPPVNDEEVLRLVRRREQPQTTGTVQSQ